MPDAFGNVTGLEFAMGQQQQSNAFLGNLNNQIGAGVWNPATSPNTDPNTGMTYPGAGMVQSYPSFGEAIYPGYGPRPGVPTQQPDYSSYVPEQAFSPGGGAGGYTPSTSYTPEQAFSPDGGAGGYTGVNELGQSYVRRNELGDPIYSGGGASFADRFNAAPQPMQDWHPPSYDGLPPAITAGVNPSANLPQVPDNFSSRFGPMGGEPVYSPSDFPGWTPPRPDGQVWNPDTYGWERAPEGQGGIGSDAGATGGRYTPAGDLLRSDLYWNGTAAVPRTDGATGYQRDAIAQEMMRSSIPSQPTANQGYNPGMENSFANPVMRQYDPSAIMRQYEEILRGIDQGTANQNLDPSWFGPGATDPGGRSYYQGDYNVGNSSAGG